MSNAHLHVHEKVMGSLASDEDEPIQNGSVGCVAEVQLDFEGMSTCVKNEGNTGSHIRAVHPT